VHHIFGLLVYVLIKRLSDAVYAKTEADRHKHEVEFVASHNGDWIKNFLEKVKEKRGFEVYRKLRDDVLKIWRKK
jgi:TorA maturation chaperone TorD